MNEFAKNIRKGHGMTPSASCIQAMKENFADAINVEWFSKKENYEAVFYRNKLEHIALFTQQGILLEYRQNLSTAYLPEFIKAMALQKGEIMNALLINKGNSFEYELIVRDKSLNRHLLLITDAGDLKEERKL